MLTTYTEMIDKAGDQLVDVLKQAEEASVSVVSTAADAVAGVVPSIPSLVPTDSLPSAAEVVKANFALAERLLDAQRAFAVHVIEAAQRPGDEKPAAKVKGPAAKV